MTGGKRNLPAGSLWLDLVCYRNRLMKVSAGLATSGQPWSRIRECPRLQPKPTPRATRPLETKSRLVTSLAV
jgi:hypothetical protein